MRLPLVHLATSFVAAVLLFAVQPWAAKMLLPSFGGSASVWLTTLLFFQASVFLGYLYAHVMSRAPRLLHATLVVLAVIGCPVAFRELGVQAPPVFQVLSELAVGVGVVVIAVSATTPLIHRWLAGDEDSSETYALYAASNAGSLLGLLAYPLAVEPWFGVEAQTGLWQALSLVFAVLIVLTALSSRRATGLRRDEPELPSSSNGRWFANAFIPASLLYGFTAYLTRDIAAVPLLWVIPLGLYLLTFIYAFSGRGRRLPDAFHWGGPLLLYGTALVTVVWPASVATLILHLVAFVAFAAYFHGELSAARPPTSEATRYYLWISFAGLAAGVFNAIIAPLVFDAPLEYLLTYGLALILLPASYATRLSSGARRLLHGAMMVVLAGAFFVAPGGLGPKLGAASLMAAAFFGALSFPALSHIMLAMFLGAVLTYPGDVTVVERARSFYGTHKVERREIDGGTYLALAVGLTQHGLERIDGELQPLGYYHASGPCGDVFEEALRRSPRAQVAIVGLGIGSMALYGRPTDHITFFELDPAIATVARSSFRTLSASAAAVEIEVADGRLGLAEAGDHYDLIVVDAFSSDAIPTHLLTLEAFEMYRGKLRKGGLLLIHTSNRHLDIDRIAIGALDAGGWTHRQRYWAADEDTPAGAWPSSWIVASPPGGTLGALEALPAWQILRSEVLWTDDYSSILRALR